MDGVDSILPASIYTAMLTCGNLLAAAVQISIVFPVFLAVVFPISIAYVGLQRFFNRTSLELKRLDAISRSPIYAHFSETLGGLSTIRAFDRGGTFEGTSLRMVDTNMRAYWLWYVGWCCTGGGGRSNRGGWCEGGLATWEVGVRGGFCVHGCGLARRRRGPARVSSGPT